ncbi:hypothetical protein, partial [Sphingomonas adhaesiva]|uniref:hypothetical protein n=1 Tax=Sphingomonas adhaesiva TaxID=28212 RepID=UPI0031844A21
LNDEAPATIQTITERLRDRAQAVSEAAENGATADFPSPAPATSKSLEVLAKPSKRRSSTTIVSTERLHNDAGRSASSPRKCSGNRRQVSRRDPITARWSRLSAGNRTAFSASANAFG